MTRIVVAFIASQAMDDTLSVVSTHAETIVRNINPINTNYNFKEAGTQ